MILRHQVVLKNVWHLCKRDVSGMDVNLFNYELPKDLIARYPLERGSERLLVVERTTGNISHLSFRDILSFLHAGDILVLNDTRVIPARIMGRKETGGRAEILLIRSIDERKWKCLIKAAKTPKNNARIIIRENLTATVESKEADVYVVSFSDPEQILLVGSVPLPPYIEREPEEADAYTYQTVYAKHDGSIAAPTAGLHFTTEILEAVRSMGVELVNVTLHVGPGTFTPVRTNSVEEHTMHDEDYYVTEHAANVLNRAMQQGRRIVAVGTTTMRVLEHLLKKYDRIVSGRGSTNLFIYNGFSFRGAGALLTNFHLPCSTLLMLVSAFGGYELIMDAYKEAIKQRYRFFSYGDAMLIV
jgi:S-adenosylmethionine:tRNA ribosyltransferase-isomerase